MSLISALLTICLYIIIKQIGTFIIQLFYIDFQKLDFIKGEISTYNQARSHYEASEATASLRPAKFRKK